MGDPDMVVVQCVQKMLEEEAPVAPAAAEGSEPEVIGRKPAEEKRRSRVGGPPAVFRLRPESENLPFGDRDDSESGSAARLLFRAES